MRLLSVGLSLTVFLLVASPTGVAQEGFRLDATTTQWYLADDLSPHKEGTRLLYDMEPEGTTSTIQFAPTADTPQDNFTWMVMEPFTEDRVFVGPATATIHFGTGVEPNSRTEVRIGVLDENGRRALYGKDTQSSQGPGQGYAQDYEIEIRRNPILREGSFLAMNVWVSNPSILTQIEYGSSEAPSSITVTTAVLDTDGDGFGDTMERNLGTDPEDVDDYPRDSDVDEDGMTDAWEAEEYGTLSEDADGDFDGDGIPNIQEFESSIVQTGIEVLVASILLLVCLSLAGVGRFWRYQK